MRVLNACRILGSTDLIFPHPRLETFAHIFKRIVNLPHPFRGFKVHELIQNDLTNNPVVLPMEFRNF